MENNVTQVAFKINGKEHTLDIDNRFTLLDILRDKLNLTGAKKGCDLGECGACTVTLDGKAVNSCQILAVKIASSEIKTIEGLNQGNILHPLQISFIENDGGQCGYCTPGFIMGAYPLFESRRNVSVEEIRLALAGNLCRCNAYGAIIDSVVGAIGIKADG
ncbi:MAG: xanthine dehydrogenase YagT iron-sulfur-binding subunit [Chloroflexi bacterium]|jgi:aerobic-type carbon monoxide dehydrogenase small subunit (CoxS/CutS family)|nr:MAG: xanthine dehydrogenase YagT iron-sulfur-binding subunit [Chloroflexota bacterium]